MILLPNDMQANSLSALVIWCSNAKQSASLIMLLAVLLRSASAKEATC
jgi:hypothetical protein